MYIDYKGIEASIINSFENLNRKSPTEVGPPAVIHKARLMVLSI